MLAGPWPRTGAGSARVVADFFLVREYLLGVDFSTKEFTLANASWEVLERAFLISKMSYTDYVVAQDVVLFGVKCLGENRGMSMFCHAMGFELTSFA